MEFWPQLYLHIDGALIFFYRLSDQPILGYYLGTAMLCLLCVVLGQLTLAATFAWNRRHIDRDNRELVHLHNLSIKALLARDKGAYKACNKGANDAFGKIFFAQIAMGISSLWPVPFALGWMQTRFGAVAFDLPLSLPLLGHKVGYLFTAIPIYVLVYIAFGKIKNHLPLFRSVARMLAQYDNQDEEQMLPWPKLAPGARETR